MLGGGFTNVFACCHWSVWLFLHAEFGISTKSMYKSETNLLWCPGGGYGRTVPPPVEQENVRDGIEEVARLVSKPWEQTHGMH